ncbi:class I SAM-dependent methyltransferase [uncultured Tateyamaria sp.]|uniref:class I SAM-dependent methyltransferase n=1 Tax=uncultured Tateyamaria sp. TaxID=455651 RepID=UPI0026111415|nr:class I SAM-dependent methyltransferase [uncultured Tateyamaria sp.]
MSNADPWDRVADGYEASAKPVFSEFAAATLDLVDIRPDQNVADIACGPGTFTTLPVERGAGVSAIDFSARMLRILERNVALGNLDGVSIHQGDGQDLPFEDNQFDAAFSLFGLMFFPDREKGYSEMFRTLRDGGTACVSSWAQLSLCPLFDVMAQSITRLDPSRRPPKYDISSLENPNVLSAEMRTAGFENVVVHRVERSFEFASADRLWHGLTEGSAPIAVMRSRLPAAAWEKLCDDAVCFIDSYAGPFPTKLGATAWIGIGRKPVA